MWYYSWISVIISAYFAPNMYCGVYENRLEEAIETCSQKKKKNVFMTQINQINVYSFKPHFAQYRLDF